MVSRLTPTDPSSPSGDPSFPRHLASRRAFHKSRGQQGKGVSIAVKKLDSTSVGRFFRPGAAPLVSENTRATSSGLHPQAIVHPFVRRFLSPARLALASPLSWTSPWGPLGSSSSPKSLEAPGLLPLHR